MDERRHSLLWNEVIVRKNPLLEKELPISKIVKSAPMCDYQLPLRSYIEATSLMTKWQWIITYSKNILMQTVDKVSSGRFTQTWSRIPLQRSFSLWLSMLYGQYGTTAIYGSCNTFTNSQASLGALHNNKSNCRCIFMNRCYIFHVLSACFSFFFYFSYMVLLGLRSC